MVRVVQVKPQEGEPVITKHAVNSFLGTNLHEQLKAAGVRSLCLVLVE